MACHLAPDENIIRSLAHTAPSLSVPRLPGPGENHGDDDGDKYDDGDHDHSDDDEVPEQLVVDDDGVDQVESKEPEEESRNPAGKLSRMMMRIFGKNFSLRMMMMKMVMMMMMLTMYAILPQ